MRITEILTKGGLKTTKQRRAVLSVLMEEQKPVTAEYIQEKSGQLIQNSDSHNKDTLGFCAE